MVKIITIYGYEFNSMRWSIKNGYLIVHDHNSEDVPTWTVSEIRSMEPIDPHTLLSLNK